MAMSSQYVHFIDRELSRNDILTTYLAARFRLLLGTGSVGFHQVELDS